jgi:putative tryptophan/tyrosine transport system substrate-binding protein
MRRRAFITLLGGAVAAWPIATRGQQPVTKTVRVGVLANEWWPPIESLREGLRERGYLEGQNLQFEYRWAQDRNERHPALAAELVALPVDVIVTWGTPAALAAKGATSAKRRAGVVDSPDVDLEQFRPGPRTCQSPAAG